MLLLSIKPKYVDLILTGEKRVELRRLRPRIDSGPALIYASSPRMELVASFRIVSVLRAPLGLLWQSVREVAGVTRKEFDAYFDGQQTGIAIRIADVAEFREPIPLADIRAAWKGFHPPQVFRYVEASHVAKLGRRRAA
jgi:predicted transcriptional regulator